MLATAIIVFREVLEAALIISIVLAASKGLAGRNTWVGGGVAAGIAGAVLVAVFAEALAAAAAGMGQELFNATILLAAVLMLGWHNVWMSQHGREMAKSVGEVGRAVAAGDRPLYALAIVCAVAVLREGSETVLFLYGIASTSGEGPAAMMLGGAMGVAGGVALGIALYFGLLSIPMRHLFTVTNWMILLLAAGMASQAAGFLVQADVVPPFGDAVWDTSWLLTENSILGKVLHALVGYVSRPAGIQVAFFVATLIVIETCTLLVARNGEATQKMATR
jgi:high-affinity iron transporter